MDDDSLQSETLRESTRVTDRNSQLDMGYHEHSQRKLICIYRSTMNADS